MRSAKDDELIVCVQIVERYPVLLSAAFAAFVAAGLAVIRASAALGSFLMTLGVVALLWRLRIAWRMGSARKGTLDPVAARRVLLLGVFGALITIPLVVAVLWAVSAGADVVLVALGIAAAIFGAGLNIAMRKASGRP